MLKKIIVLVLIVFLSACKAPDNQTKKKSIEITPKAPVTENVDLKNYSKVIYISIIADENGNGTKDSPYNSIKEGLKKIGDNGKTALLVAVGIYEENNLEIKSGTELFGGYCSKFKERNVEKNITIISGSKKDRIMRLSNNTRIDGFTLMKGQIRDKGAAIFTTAKNVTISNNVFANNKTLKPKPWNPKFWHETANDGGAIYCGDGAEVNIKNNLFVSNQTENGRGGGLAADNKCRLQIVNNVFLNNTAGLDDPMRSSDAGAVSIFRWSTADIDNNIFLSNTALAHNDAGGIWVALWSSANITNNVFVDNEAGDDAGAIFVGGQEHRYDAPLDKLPPKDKFFVSIAGNTIIGNRNASMNSGAMRLTMESRGEFVNNVTAFNNGIYFQRSEVLISGNTILDNFLLVETKEGLKPCVVKDNIIWADYKQNVEAEVSNNNMKYQVKDEDNYSKIPKFKNNGLNLTLASSNYFSKKSFTVLMLLNKKFAENELVNRVVKIGERWSVVKSNESNLIELWGNFAGETTITILPTYKIKR